MLKVLAARYRASNPGSRVQVVGYESRPLIHITPPTDASDRRVKSYNFVEAVKTLPTNFTPSEVESIMARVNSKLYKSLRATFIVLDDDMPRPERVKKSGSAVATEQSRDANRPGKRAHGSPNDVEVTGSKSNKASRSRK